MRASKDRVSLVYRLIGNIVIAGISLKLENNIECFNFLSFEDSPNPRLGELVLVA